MDIELTDIQKDIIREVRRLCERFPETYWRELDQKHEYPEVFVRALMEAGWLSILIPEDYGGGGVGMVEAALVLREICRTGCNAAPAHAQMYTMGAVVRHGSEEQKRRYLPKIARGELRLQSFAVTEPNAGTDTTRITTTATRDGDKYIIRGQKIFISRVQHSDLMMLITRTTPREEVEKRTDGMTLFLVDLRTAGDRLTVRPIQTMINAETNELFFDGLEVPVENRIGEEGKGFRYLLSGVNSERIAVAAEAVGSGLYFVDKASQYSRDRVVFGRPIGQNQGVQLPIAKAYANLQAANLAVFHAARLYDQEIQCGEEANIAKLLASEAHWEAANAAMTAFGGYGYAVEFDIERHFRHARLGLIAPVSNNLVLSYLGHQVLGMPRSY
jgi:acyl-CoA dehydrogenase